MAWTKTNTHTHTSTATSSFDLTHPLLCKPSLLALCDDVTFFSPQGGCWGLKSPAGHPRHPSYPLPFVPWWGNCHLRVDEAGWHETRPSTLNPCSAPSPLLFWLVCYGKIPVPLLLPADSMISPSLFTSHCHTQTHTPIDSHTLYHDSESAPMWNFKNLKILVSWM